jgi:hypothetical protein
MIFLKMVDLENWLLSVLRLLNDYMKFCSNHQDSTDFQTLKDLLDYEEESQEYFLFLKVAAEELYQIHLCVLAGYFTVEDMLSEIDSALTDLEAENYYCDLTNWASVLNNCYCPTKGFDLFQLGRNGLEYIGPALVGVWNELGIGNHVNLALKKFRADAFNFSTCYGPLLPTAIEENQILKAEFLLGELEKLSESDFDEWLYS